MKLEIVNGYYVAGNDHVAIAINCNDENDSHYFTPHSAEQTGGLPMTAFDRAIAWTSPGI